MVRTDYCATQTPKYTKVRGGQMFCGILPPHIVDTPIDCPGRPGAVTNNVCMECFLSGWGGNMRSWKTHKVLRRFVWRNLRSGGIVSATLRVLNIKIKQIETKNDFFFWMRGRSRESSGATSRPQPRRLLGKLWLYGPGRDSTGRR